MRSIETRPRPQAWRAPSSWWPMLLGVLLFGAALVLGTLAKGLGRSSPELGVDVVLAGERHQPATALALFIHSALAPAGGVLILALVCLLLAFVLRRPLTALAFGSTASVGWLSSEAGKLIVARLRPPAGVTHALVMESSADSFPSGHTALAVGLAWAIVLVFTASGSRRVLAVSGGILGVAVVAGSRLYLGVHYPSDVIGAIVIASAGVLIWWPLWSRVIEPRLRETTLIRRLTATR